MVGDYRDTDTLADFAEGLSLATYEFENVPVETAEFLAQRLPLFPPPAALAVAQERLAEKEFFTSLGIPTPPFVPINQAEELASAVEKIGLPAVLKTRRFGYDGKGQLVLSSSVDLTHAWQKLGGVPLILEGFVKFDREVSLIAARSKTRQMAFYPLVENHHRDGILRLSLAPAPNLTPALQALAEDYARKALAALNYVGVLAIEFFQVGDQLLANEMAPRVHNSGHWTIEGAITSQFAQHLRAVVGLPLGSTETAGHVAMVNLIGKIPSTSDTLALPEAHLHLYGKTAQPGRKLGHITLCDRDEIRLHERLTDVGRLLGEGEPKA
jgi:5-(carboxyamino)imidazole ribonucleotide synthase